MNDTINKNAIPIIEKQAKLDVPKKRLFSVKKLFQGVITSAEKICHCAKDELKNHLEHRVLTTKSFQKQEIFFGHRCLWEFPSSIQVAIVACI
ncbi:hypothetical protein MAM1_0172d07206 [Mucor ambiguus]|uniref:Uncharacterized protein n=1 Tax=Mucor ambiguus TaxID=91626 RepID=A0A0C9MJW0_9FUNG|nr:hypothetical protein MAM1_0172d07206 [Mucor ambiguus]